jgi:hypothetical protein
VPAIPSLTLDLRIYAADAKACTDSAYAGGYVRRDGIHMVRTEQNPLSGYRLALLRTGRRESPECCEFELRLKTTNRERWSCGELL